MVKLCEEMLVCVSVEYVRLIAVGAAMRSCSGSVTILLMYGVSKEAGNREQGFRSSVQTEMVHGSVLSNRCQ